VKPEEVINVQLEAYNRRDLEASAATYASDIQVIETDGSRPTLVGIEALRERFGTKTFKLDGLNAEIRSRIIAAAGSSTVPRWATNPDGSAPTPCHPATASAFEALSPGDLCPVGPCGA